MKPGYYVRRLAVKGMDDQRPRWFSTNMGWSYDPLNAQRFASIREAGVMAHEDDQVVDIGEDDLEVIAFRKADSNRLVPVAAERIEDLREVDLTVHGKTTTEFRRWGRPRRNYVPPIGGDGPDGRSAWSTPIPPEKTP